MCTSGSVVRGDGTWTSADVLTHTRTPVDEVVSGAPTRPSVSRYEEGRRVFNWGSVPETGRDYGEDLRPVGVGTVRLTTFVLELLISPTE